MEPSQKIVRHWILNLAIKGTRRLSDIVPYVESLHLNVRSVPGATTRHYSDAFLSLFDAGLICCFRDEDERSRRVEVGRSVVESVLALRLQLPEVSRRTRSTIPGPLGPAIPDLMWKLTSAGGVEWERLAQPDWERFVFILFDLPTNEGLPTRGDAWSASLDSLMVEIGWCREFNNEEVDRQSLALEVLSNHPIVYWKVLPVVYHATFMCTSVWQEGIRLREKSSWFSDWWSSRRSWFKEPWALPDWPDSKILEN
jgi:hypothetical protein